jgi:hypothetical protein
MPEAGSGNPESQREGAFGGCALRRTTLAGSTQLTGRRESSKGTACPAGDLGNVQAARIVMPMCRVVTPDSGHGRDAPLALRPGKILPWVGKV